jgi:PKD domain
MGIEVSTTNQGAPMTTSFLISSLSRRIASMVVGTLLAIVALLAIANPASAIPVNHDPGGGNNPPPLEPIARFTITPNPVVVNGGVSDITVGGTGVVQPVKAAKAKAAALPNFLIRGVKFDASKSFSPSGVADYKWDLDGDGTYETDGSKIEFKKFSVAGTYHIGLKIVDADNSGLTDTVTHDLVVYNAPKAVIAAAPQVALLGQQVSFSAAGSTGDGGVTNYSWDLDGNGTFETDTGTTPTASTSYQSLGQRKVSVRVKDSHGTIAVASVNETVTRAPSAAFTFAPSPAVVGETVRFDGSQSSDDSKVVDYAWDLDGNGTFETDTKANPKTTMKYNAPGTVNVRLRVTDDNGLQDIVTHAVEVLAQPPADTTAPRVSIAPHSVKMSRKGFLSMRILCPDTERSCSGRLSLASLLRGAHGSKLGAGAFNIGGGQTAKVKIHLSRKNQRLVRKLHKLGAQATASAKDAAGNSGLSKARVTIKR